jgi:hypothetical protein
MKYSRCDRCELNYVPEGEQYCDLCKKEMSGKYNDEVNDDVNIDENICPYCEKHKLEYGEEICSFCLNKKIIKQSKNNN